MKHSSELDSTGTGEDKEWSHSCSCRTAYTGRLGSHTEAVAVRSDHKIAVADGTWQAKQDAEAHRLGVLRPLHDAQRELGDAVDERRSAGFGVLIARQHGGDIDAAIADLEAADVRLAAANAALALVTFPTL